MLQPAASYPAFGPAWPASAPLAARRPGLESLLVVVSAMILASDIAEKLLGFGKTGGGYPIQVHLTYFAMYGLYGLLLLRMTGMGVGLLVRAPLIMVLLAYPMVTLAWSVEPGETLERGIALVGSSLFGVFLGWRYDLRTMLRLVAFACALSAIGSFVLIHAMPSMGIATTTQWVGTWIGLHFHKSALGATSAFGAIVLTYAVWQARGWTRLFFLGGLLLSLVLLVGSKSTGSLLTTVGIMTLVLWIRLCQRLPLQVPMLTVIGSVAIIAVGVELLTSNQVERFLAYFGKDMELSSRLPIWELVWQYVQQKYWFGFGYEAFWNPEAARVKSITKALYFTPYYSHNGLLETWLNGGLVLVLLVAAIIVKSVFKAFVFLFRWRDSIVSTFPVMFLGFFLISNFAESMILSRNSLVWCMFIAVNVFMARMVNFKMLGGESQFVAQPHPHAGPLAPAGYAPAMAGAYPDAQPIDPDGAAGEAAGVWGDDAARAPMPPGMQPYDDDGYDAPLPYGDEAEDPRGEDRAATDLPQGYTIDHGAFPPAGDPDRFAAETFAEDGDQRGFQPEAGFVPEPGLGPDQGFAGDRADRFDPDDADEDEPRRPSQKEIEDWFRRFER